MRNTNLRNAILLFAAAALPACAEPGTEGEPADQIVWNDQVFDRVDYVDADGASVLPEVVAAPSGGEQRALAAQTREELAESLRMMILHPNGGAYVAQEPNWAAADAMLTPGESVDRTPRLDVFRGEAGEDDASAYGALERIVRATGAQISQVIGSDGRNLSPTTLAPFNAIARVHVYDSPSGGGYRTTCTGAYIGPWTFVLAGHCLRFDTSTFARRIVFEPARQGSSLPFGTRDCRNGDGTASNDFLAAAPAGYTGSLDHSLDFAVIDTYPCHAAPRYFNGYSVNTGTTTYNVHGYPHGRCPGASSEGTFMCGMSGLGYVNSWRLESEHIDATDGQDGAPWWTTNPTRVAGIHNGYRQYHDFGRCGFDVCRRNYARRIDGTVDSFIRDIAFDF